MSELKYEVTSQGSRHPTGARASLWVPYGATYAGAYILSKSIAGLNAPTWYEGQGYRQIGYLERNRKSDCSHWFFVFDPRPSHRTSVCVSITDVLSQRNNTRDRLTGLSKYHTTDNDVNGWK